MFRKRKGAGRRAREAVDFESLLGTQQVELAGGYKRRTSESVRAGKNTEGEGIREIVKDLEKLNNLLLKQEELKTGGRRRRRRKRRKRRGGGARKQGRMRT